jgi:beta-xylosidase
MMIAHVFKKNAPVFLILLAFVSGTAFAQNQPYTSKVWMADNGDGTFKNPVLHADYSDPDACRVGDDYYMVASSFNASPGLPILHSKDLVNWKLLSYALPIQIPELHFNAPQHGNGVWAPAIRFHNGEFYIYYPDPDFGIYMIKAKDPAGSWSEPVMVLAGKGIIDPCPLWETDAATGKTKAYLVHAYAGSRAGIKSIIALKQMNAEGTSVIDKGVLVYDGHDTDPTIEGPKMYKRNGYYYIFAPAGGVSTGWQLVLRSKNIYGPYERKVVMDQGKTPINGPHQGAWVDTKTGEDWFLHFQDKEAYGRIVHLQPMVWKNDWPVIGEDTDGDGNGQPVLRHKKPNVGKTYAATAPEESDEFNGAKLGLQWQWQANEKATWAFANPGSGKLRLFSAQMPDSFRNYWDVPNILYQKFPAETFTATAKFQFKPRLDYERFGMIVIGMNYAYISLLKKPDGIYVTYNVCTEADKGRPEKEQVIAKMPVSDAAYFRIEVKPGGICQFAYSSNGTDFTGIPGSFIATVGKWIGARIGMFCTRFVKTNDSGFADVDWFRVE